MEEESRFSIHPSNGFWEEEVGREVCPYKAISEIIVPHAKGSSHG
jgi:hypothetical protein